MRMFHVSLSALVLTSACGEAPTERSYAFENVPASLRAERDRADTAIQALQAALIERLTDELGSEGPQGAIHVCRDEAQAITARAASEEGIAVGRTSHRLRNQANAPRPWLERLVADGAGKKYDEVHPTVVDLGDRVGVVRPIGTLGICTQCHGGSGDVLPDVREAIVEAYPDDEAVGFSIGDLRGWAWAEAPKGRE